MPADDLGFGRPDDMSQQQPKLDADFIAKAKTGGGSRKMILPGVTLREQEKASEKQ